MSDTESDKMVDSSDQQNIDRSILIAIQQIEEEMLVLYAKVTGDVNDLDHVEFQTQVRRVLYILDLSILKLEIGFCLPFIYQNWNTLKNQYSNEETKVLNVFSRYIRMEKDDDNLKYVEENPILIDCISMAINTKLKDLIPKYITEISSEAYQYLRKMRELRKLIEWRMIMTAPKAMSKEKVLHKMWTENEKRKVKISELKDMLQAQEQKFEKNASIKTASIVAHNKKIKHLQEKNYIEINKEINTSHHLMHGICTESKTKQDDLQRKAMQGKEDYEVLLQNNINSAKKLREKKLKIQQNLQNWLNKYDVDVGDKSKEVLRLRDELDNTKREFDKWKIEFERQEAIFTILMAEKEIEDLRIREEKLVIFIMNRSARIIQAAFRIYLQQKKKKKKGKKGKKK